MTRSAGAAAQNRALPGLRQALDMGAVAVIGAGLSIAARFPTTSGLDALLRDSLNGDQESPDEQPSWSVLANNTDAREKFQAQFAALDRRRSAEPSIAHEALARLIHAGIVETVVSLNWDTALERAYERMYGVSIPIGILFKPHGDAADPSTDWVLPHEDGVVTAEVRRRVDGLVDEHARTLVIIGYSESDETISRELIRQLDNRWKTIRIGPSVTGLADIPLSADEALAWITSDLQEAEDTNSWHSVRFQGSRGFEAALAGERLGPSDVDVCPEFAEVSRVIEGLENQRAVVLNGASGSGKSITAYQSLRKLAQSGYEVLRLRDNARANSTASWLSDLRKFPQRKVLFIDDAQDISADIVREIAESANQSRLVLIVGVDQIAGGVKTVNISGIGAVAQLTQYVRTNSRALTPLVAVLDDQIGDRSLQTPLEFRLAAAEHEDTPWRFFYVLTGGWRRARRLALELRDQDRADLALAAVAVAQIAGVDAGVTRSNLHGLLDKLNRDEVWLDSALQVLVARRAVIESDDRLRCPHLQAAYQVVEWFLHPPSYDYTPTQPIIVGAIASAGQQSTQVASVPSRTVKQKPMLPPSEILADQTVTSGLIGHYLDLPTTPLRGCTWLVGRGMSSDARRVLEYRTKLLDDERWRMLANQALDSAPDSTAEAAQLLSEALSWSPDVIIPLIRLRKSAISVWFREITPQNAWALGGLINGLYNHDHTSATRFSAEIAAYASVKRLVALMLDGGWGHIYSTARGIERIMAAADSDMRAAVARELNRDEYQKFLTAKRDNLDAMSLFVTTVAAIDREFAINLFQETAKEFGRLYSVDPVHSWGEIFDLLGFTLGFAPHFLRGRTKPSRQAHMAARAFSAALDIPRIARAVEQPAEEWDGTNFPELLSFLSEASPSVLDKVVSAVDVKQFEQNLFALNDPSIAVFYVAAIIWEHRPDDIYPVLDRYEPSLTVLNHYFALMSPELALRAMTRGVPLDLKLHHQEWALATDVVERLAAVDRKLTAELLDANLAPMVEGLAGNFSNPFEGLARWISVIDELHPSHIERVLAALPEGAVRRWSSAIRRPQKYGHARRLEIVPLVFRALTIPGHVQQEARELLRRFPSLSH